MANDLTKSPWVIDTAATIVTSPVRILSMVYKPAAAENDLTITDKYGKTFWDVDALAATPAGDQSFDQSAPIRMQGFIVSVIDAGALWVWVE